jgi:predicted neuraminidase
LLQIGRGIRRIQRICCLSTGQRQDHLYQRHTIGQTMMHPANEGATGAIRFDQVHLPWRPVHVKGGANQHTDGPLQSSLIAWRRQDDSLHMVVEIKAKMIFPIGSSPGQPRWDHPLSKAIKSQEAGFDGRLELLYINRRPQNQYPRDDDRVSRIVHAQQ